MKKIREMQKDKIYAQPKSPIDDFRFDDDIANVFEDMVQRSIPGYSLSVLIFEDVLLQSPF